MGDEVKVEKYTCDVCEVEVEVSEKEKHEASAKHITALESYDVIDVSAVVSTEAPEWFKGPRGRGGARVKTKKVEESINTREYHCEVCDIAMFEVNKAQHIEGRRHKANAAAAASAGCEVYHCPLCSKTMALNEKARHKESRLHLQNAATEANLMWNCKVCGVVMPMGNKDAHEKGMIHLSRANPTKAIEKQKEKRAEQRLRRDERITDAEHLCVTCNTCLAVKDKAEHLKSERHEKPHETQFYCEFCRRSMNTDQRSEHLTSWKHKQQVETRALPKESGTWKCEVCDRTMPLASKESHNVGAAHRRKLNPVPQGPVRSPSEKRRQNASRMAHKGKHPNGKRAVPVRDVRKVYWNTVDIPVTAYINSGEARTIDDMVTPDGVGRAKEHYRSGKPPVNKGSGRYSQSSSQQQQQQQPQHQPQQQQQQHRQQYNSGGGYSSSVPQRHVSQQQAQHQTYQVQQSQQDFGRNRGQAANNTLNDALLRNSNVSSQGSAQRILADQARVTLQPQFVAPLGSNMVVQSMGNMGQYYQS